MIKNHQLKLLAIIIITLSTSSLANGTIYFITIQRTGNELSVNSIEFAEGPGPNYIDQSGKYRARIISFKNQELSAYNFSANEQPIIERPSDSSVTTKELQNNSEELITITFPYYNNAKKIEILEENGKLRLEIDLSAYARCNENDFCDFNEDLQKCPEDCRKEIARPEVKADEAKKEEAIEEIQAAIEEPKEETLLGQLEEKGISRNLIIIIAVLALILVIIIILARKKKE